MPQPIVEQMLKRAQAFKEQLEELRSVVFLEQQRAKVRFERMNEQLIEKTLGGTNFASRKKPSGVTIVTHSEAQTELMLGENQMSEYVQTEDSAFSVLQAATQDEALAEQLKALHSLKNDTMDSLTRVIALIPNLKSHNITTANMNAMPSVPGTPVSGGNGATPTPRGRSSSGRSLALLKPPPIAIANPAANSGITMSITVRVNVSKSLCSSLLTTLNAVR